MANLIGGGADQVSTNGMLGTAAFVDVDQLPIPGSITTALAAKQDTLVSGTNIKTVNGTSLLGSGNVSIAGGGALVLLATITPTASANIDALNVFNSTYDDYLIVGNGVGVAADDSIRFRLANTGTVDSGSNYYNLDYAGTESFSSSIDYAVTLASQWNTGSGGKGCDFTVTVRNANSTTLIKGIDAESVFHTPPGGYRGYKRNGAYIASSAVSGFRFYGFGGSNFSAQGSIKVYGFAKV